MPDSKTEQILDVLLIEDTVSMARVYLEYLRRGPYQVRHCVTGRDALVEIAMRAPHGVLLDLRLPDIDGIEMLELIRARCPQTAVVVITADGSLNRAIEAMRAGAVDFVVKPFNADRLLTTLASALRRQFSVSGAPFGEQRGMASIRPLHVVEREAIETAIEACEGNIVEAAALLEVSPSTLYRKLSSWQTPLPAGEAALDLPRLRQ